MKHKISFFILVLLTSACGVELRDRNKTDSEQPTPTIVQAQDMPDYLIDSAVTLSEDKVLEVNRLILTKDAVITTESHHLTIIAKEVVSESAIIRNFAEGARASLEQNGRMGGTITIKAAKASGHLHIELRGEAGGSGKSGAHPILSTTQLLRSGCPGTNGGKGGNAGQLHAEVSDMSGMNMTWKNQEGSLGPAGKGYSASWGDPNAIKPPCNERLRGADGAPGNKGQICLKFGNQESFQCN